MRIVVEAEAWGGGIVAGPGCHRGGRVWPHGMRVLIVAVVDGLCGCVSLVRRRVRRKKEGIRTVVVRVDNDNLTRQLK